MQRQENIVIRLSKEEKEEMAELANQYGLSLSEYVRTLLPVCGGSESSKRLTRYERDVLGLVMNGTLLLRKLSVSMGHDDFIEEVKDWSDEWLSKNYNVEKKVN